jgi:hypothetical protein
VLICSVLDTTPRASSTQSLHLLPAKGDAGSKSVPCADAGLVTRNRPQPSPGMGAQVTLLHLPRKPLKVPPSPAPAPVPPHSPLPLPLYPSLSPTPTPHCAALFYLFQPSLSVPPPSLCIFAPLLRICLCLVILSDGFMERRATMCHCTRA